MCLLQGVIIAVGIFIIFNHYSSCSRDTLLTDNSLMFFFQISDNSDVLPTSDSSVAARTIFVSNLSFDVDEDLIKSFFKKVYMMFLMHSS